MTDASGQLNAECEAGKQLWVTAPSEKLFTSAPASVRETFNCAPVKLRLLGLLGGGASTLPSSYLAAEFLGINDGAFVNSKVITNGQHTIDCTVQVDKAFSSGTYVLGGYMNRKASLIPRSCIGIYNNNWYAGWNATYGDGAADTQKHEFSYRETRNVDRECLKVDGKVVETSTSATVIQQVDNSSMSWYLGGRSSEDGTLASTLNAKHFRWRFWDGTGKLVACFIPALDTSGVPCMFDTVSKQQFRNSGTGQFIVGMNLEQARKLSKLPSTGGTLTVSLPSNYAEDEGVVNALATAQDNGWKITIQTYEAEAGAASTFALRRIWVRKTQNEQGSYVDTDGFRWQVEWCVDVVGSSPEAEGYEPFRRVEAAVAYWNLQPWVDPEQEELLTNNEEV